jgi:hypothetical protein
MAPPSPHRKKLKVSNNLKEQLTAELENILVKAAAASAALEKLLAKKEQLTAALKMIPTVNTPPIVPVLAVLARGTAAIATNGGGGDALRLDPPLLPQSSNIHAWAGMIKMDNSKPIRMPHARMVSNYTNDSLGMSETTLPYTLSPQKSTIGASKRAKNTTVSYCDTVNLGLESNAADSEDSDEYELDPEEDIEDESITADSESESELDDEEVIDEEDEEVTKPSIATKPSTATRTSLGTKPSTVTNSSTTTKPSATLSQDKEKRATNKKIKEEVLQNITQFKAVLGVPRAFGPEHWKELLSQMVNVGDYANQFFFGQSRVSQSWRAETLV